ncbi:hypothetical protein, partial [Xanthomonas translucens]
MDQGVIASLLQHPLTSAVVLLDAEGRPLAANRAAQALELPRTVEAYAELMRDVRERLLGGESMLACALPGT